MVKEALLPVTDELVRKLVLLPVIRLVLLPVTGDPVTSLRCMAVAQSGEKGPRPRYREGAIAFSACCDRFKDPALALYVSTRWKGYRATVCYNNSAIMFSRTS